MKSRSIHSANDKIARTTQLTAANLLLVNHFFERGRKFRPSCLKSSVLALSLPMTGIFGLASYSVARRMRDFGIRLALGASCPKSTPAANIDPCEGLRDNNPHCGWAAHWDDSGVSTNEIDGRRTEFLLMESSNPDGADFGDLHYAKLKLCFDDGELCGKKTIGVGVQVHGMLASSGYDEEYSTPVRIRFDDETPMRQTWGISDNHEMLFPYGHEKQFAQEMLAHKKLIVEFSYYEHAPRTVSFDLSGLGDAMQHSGLSF